MSLQQAIADADRSQSERPVQKPTSALVPGLAVAAVLVAIAIIVRSFFSQADDPFRYARVSGKVSYDDGALIPAEGLVLTFIPIETVSLNKKFARPGLALVDQATGEFNSATTREPNDGVVFGRHRVVLGVSGMKPLPHDIVPAIYKDQGRSPLEVDTRSQPFDIRISRPTKR